MNYEIKQLLAQRRMSLQDLWNAVNDRIEQSHPLIGYATLSNYLAGRYPMPDHIRRAVEAVLAEAPVKCDISHKL